MRMVDLIDKKRLGQTLSQKEIDFIVQGYVQSLIPDYQMSAWLMAVCFQGLNDNELYHFTNSLIHSGEQVDLSRIQGMKLDKHSTGGVGDKTTLVLAPLVASAGGKVAKMSGRGLGHTGGTLDKLESIPEYQTTLALNGFIDQVNKIGVAVIGQSEHLVVGDKKIYALRDVTGTVESKELIAASIMSKKIASGADAILLDVKYGNGAFMKTKEDARDLALRMLKIARAFHKESSVMMTNMNQPLGNAIGNQLEVLEAIDTLQNKGPEDLKELCLFGGSYMLLQGHIVSSFEEGYALLEEKLKNGEAFKKFREMVKWQHGNVDYIDDPKLFKEATYRIDIRSKEEGYIEYIDSYELGHLCMLLGGGRRVKEDVIDPQVGIVLSKKVGDLIKQGEILMTIHSNNPLEDEMYETIDHTITISKTKIEKPKLIEQVITFDDL